MTKLVMMYGGYILTRFHQLMLRRHWSKIVLFTFKKIIIPKAMEIKMDDGCIGVGPVGRWDHLGII